MNLLGIVLDHQDSNFSLCAGWSMNTCECQEIWEGPSLDSSGDAL